VTCSKRHIDDEPVCPKKHIQMAKCDSRTKTKKWKILFSKLLLCFHCKNLLWW